jgi:hypothetical protein
MDKAFSSISVTSSLTGGNALEVSGLVASFSGEQQLRVAHQPGRNNGNQGFVPGAISTQKVRFLMWSVSIESGLITGEFSGFCAGSLSPAMRLGFYCGRGPEVYIRYRPDRGAGSLMRHQRVAVTGEHMHLKQRFKDFMDTLSDAKSNRTKCFVPRTCYARATSPEDNIHGTRGPRWESHLKAEALVGRTAAQALPYFQEDVV